jgi:hypothetical protein
MKMKYKLEKFAKVRLNGVSGWGYEVFEKNGSEWVFAGSFFAKTKKEAKVKWGIK